LATTREGLGDPVKKFLGYAKLLEGLIDQLTAEQALPLELVDRRPGDVEPLLDRPIVAPRGFLEGPHRTPGTLLGDPGGQELGSLEEGDHLLPRPLGYHG
jgi:hypothetical protein